MYRPRLSDFHRSHIQTPLRSYYDSGHHRIWHSIHSQIWAWSITHYWPHWEFSRYHILLDSLRIPRYCVLPRRRSSYHASIWSYPILIYTCEVIGQVAKWYKLHLSIPVYWPLSTESMGLYSKWTRQTYTQRNRLSRRPSNQYRRYRRVESKPRRRLILATASLWTFYRILVSSRE